MRLRYQMFEVPGAVDSGVLDSLRMSLTLRGVE
jgi:hypothetical protein